MIIECRHHLHVRIRTVSEGIDCELPACHLGVERDKELFVDDGQESHHNHAPKAGKTDQARPQMAFVEKVVNFPVRSFIEVQQRSSKGERLRVNSEQREQRTTCELGSSAVNVAGEVHEHLRIEYTMLVVLAISRDSSLASFTLTTVWVKNATPYFRPPSNPTTQTT